MVLMSCLHCSSKKEVATKLPQTIDEVYFQKWIGGQELSGSGTDFHLKFKNPLPDDCYLQKVYFQNQEAVFEIENETTFVAHLYNKTPQDKRAKPDFPFDIQPNEAILEFHINNKITHVKIANIKEKELIAYPAMGREKN